MSDLGNRTVRLVIPSDSPIIVRGARVGVTIDYTAIISDVPAYSLWVPNTDNKYVPLVPVGKISSASTTAITMDSAAEASKFDPAGSDINPYWLTANGGSQEVCYYDKDADRTVTGITVASMGEIYEESQAVASVSGAVVTLGTAFTADPSANDYLLPGGIEGSSIHKQAIIIPRAVTVDEIRAKQTDWTAKGYGVGTVLGYDRLPTSIKTLYDNDIIVADANIKIDITK